ncbi:hypothetical protein B0I37DRAFT_380958 [Chaetomium sp. MPI-CAGE-AT-0009]|nr:hypothetical protein B0I37DRAFT_380958 [Chaetomium sp. MPI-CAGE-AT-0009]
MVSCLLLVLLIPYAFAIAGRQDGNCGCEELENGIIWEGVQPSSVIQRLCEESPGDPHACSREVFGDVCVGSENRETCDCMLEEARRLETQYSGTNDWTLLNLDCTESNVTIYR